jgi:glutamyl-tRNA synthetase
MNGIYLRQMPEGELAQWLSEAVNAYLKDNPTPVYVEPTAESLRPLVPLIQERLKTLAPDEVWELCEPFLVETPDYDIPQLVQKGMDSEGALAALRAVSDTIGEVTSFDADTLEGVLRPLAEELELKTRELFGTIRVAVTGRTAAPPLFDTLAVLGKERVLSRLGRVVTILDEGA